MPLEDRSAAHSLSISSAYKAVACLRMIFPLAERGSGFAGSVTKIISLNNLAKAGAWELPSSIAGLFQHELHSGFAEKKSAPNHVTEFCKSDFVVRINDILGLRLNEDTGLWSRMTEHQCALHSTMGKKDVLLSDGHDFFAFQTRQLVT